MFPKLGRLGKHPSSLYLCRFLSTVPTAIEMVSHQGMNNHQNVPSVNTLVYVIAKEVTFVLKLLGPILPVHFHRFHKKNIEGDETEATGELSLVC